MMESSDLDEQLGILLEARHENPFWFEAIIQCAEVIIDRRQKYSAKRHSYFIFADIAQKTGLTVRQVFEFFITTKLSRFHINTGDFPDEKEIDTLQDLANYALLALGWFMSNLSVSEVLDYTEE